MSSERHLPKSTLQALLIIACLWPSLALFSLEAQVSRDPGDGTGLFLIHAQASRPEDLPPRGVDQQVVKYDYKFLREEEQRSAKYFLLPKHPDVALKLARKPQSSKNDQGRTELLFELSPDAAADMERLTSKNLGRAVAFVIDGEVVTAHKIRSVIRDGQFVLSRCTDNACEYIQARLAVR